MQIPAYSPPLMLRVLVVAATTVLVVGYILGHYRVLNDAVPHATAERFLVKEDGNLYSLSDVFGEHKITGNGKFQFIFDEKPGKLLVGEGWETDSPGNVERLGGSKLFLMNEDGSMKKLLTDKKVIAGKMDKKGAQIFFNTDTLDLFRASQDGSSVEKIQSKAISFDVSPDGRYIVYQKQTPEWQVGDYYDAQLGIAILDTQTNQETLITNKAEDFNPIWTPDQRKILFFSASPEGLASHFIMNPDGSEPKQLTNHGQVFVSSKTVPMASEMPIWSEDGRFLVYESDRSIWINEFDKNYNSIVRTRKIGYGKEPKWNSDGKSINVIVGEGIRGKSNLMKLDLNGTILK